MDTPATLVTPQRTIHVLKSRQALHKLCESRTPKADSKLEGNIRQLLGWDPTANGSPRWEAEDHFCLEDGRESWVVHASCDAYFPLFGSGPEKFKQLKKYCPEVSITMSDSSCKRLLSKVGNAKDGWTCVSRPSAVAQLPNGASLFNIPKCLMAEPHPALARLSEVVGGAVQTGCASVDCSRVPGSLEVSFSSLEPFSSRAMRLCRSPRPNPISCAIAPPDRDRDRCASAPAHRPRASTCQRALRAFPLVPDGDSWL